MWDLNSVRCRYKLTTWLCFVALISPMVCGEDEEGIRIGALIVKPSLFINQRYETNILRTEDDRIDDFITTIRPQIGVQARPYGHSLSFSYTLNRNIYSERTEFTHNEHFFKFDSELRSESGEIDFYGRWMKLVEPTGTVITDKIERTRSEYGISATVPRGRFELSAGVDFQELRYKDRPFTRLDYDSTVLKAGVRYRLSRSNALQFEIEKGNINRLSAGQKDQDFSKYVLSVRTDLSGKFVQKAGLGYLETEAGADVAYLWQLFWKPTGRTVVGVSADVVPTYNETGRTQVQKSFSASVWQGLGERISAYAISGFTRSEIADGATLDRYSLRIGLNYRIGEKLNLRWEFEQIWRRNRTGSGGDYENTSLSAGLSFSF